MGTTASILSLPPSLDKTAAQQLAGGALEEGAFERLAPAGLLTREQWVQAASTQTDDPALASLVVEANTMFERFRLRGEQLQELNEDRWKLNPDAVELDDSDPVMKTSELRSAFAVMGDEIESKQLFPLVQKADPEAEGIIRLPAFVEYAPCTPLPPEPPSHSNKHSSFRRALRIRRTALAEEREKEHFTAAYVALGGSTDKEKTVRSEMLKAIVTDFVGAAAVEHAMALVIKHKMKAVQV